MSDLLDMGTGEAFRTCPACGASLRQDETHWSLYPEPMGGYVCPRPTMSEEWRPAFCPDRGCTPLIHPLTDPDNMDRGFSRPGFAVFCFGRLADPIDWMFAAVVHHETLSQCQSSPLKGNVRWFDNIEDWSALARAYRAATTAALEADHA